MKVVNKDGLTFEIRSLAKDDVSQLSTYFINLSDVSKNRYGPHPLTAEYAQYLCTTQQLLDEKVIRLVITNHHLQIIGYFILDSNVVMDDAHRYEQQGFNLYDGLYLFLAPSIADEYQNQGIASRVMPKVIALAKKYDAKKLILMGGTQLNNEVAVNYYQNVGFIALSKFQTEVANVDMYMPLTN
jgi:GNAT superfamily N-acetyltransferase